MIYKYVKCESVIAKIMADLDLSESNLRTTDIKEWIFEAIEKIGAPLQYISRLSGVDGVPVYKILDNQIPIPSDLVHLDGVAYSTNKNGPWLPVSTLTGIFKNDGKYIKHTPINNLDKQYNLAIEELPKEELQPMQRKYPTTLALIVKSNNHSAFGDLVCDVHKQDVEYFIKPGWIVFNTNVGYVKLAYKAIATDERGYPLIPDLASYQEAIFWYVNMKLNYPKFLKGNLGGKLKSANITIYYYIQSQWNYYRNQAYGECMMPTNDDMLNVKNDWNKLVPDWDGDDTFFKYIGKEQTIYNDYYNGF